MIQQNQELLLKKRLNISKDLKGKRKLNMKKRCLKSIQKFLVDLCWLKVQGLMFQENQTIQNIIKAKKQKIIIRFLLKMIKKATTKLKITKLTIDMKNNILKDITLKRTKYVVKLLSIRHVTIWWKSQMILKVINNKIIKANIFLKTEDIQIDFRYFLLFEYFCSEK